MADVSNPSSPQSPSLESAEGHDFDAGLDDATVAASDDDPVEGGSDTCTTGTTTCRIHVTDSLRQAVQDAFVALKQYWTRAISSAAAITEDSIRFEFGFSADGCTIKAWHPDVHDGRALGVIKFDGAYGAGRIRVMHAGSSLQWRDFDLESPMPGDDLGLIGCLCTLIRSPQDYPVVIHTSGYRWTIPASQDGQMMVHRDRLSEDHKTRFPFSVTGVAIALGSHTSGTDAGGRNIHRRLFGENDFLAWCSAAGLPTQVGEMEE